MRFFSFPCCGSIRLPITLSGLGCKWPIGGVPANHIFTTLIGISGGHMDWKPHDRDGIEVGLLDTDMFYFVLLRWRHLPNLCQLFRQSGCLHRNDNFSRWGYEKWLQQIVTVSGPCLIARKIF